MPKIAIRRVIEEHFEVSDETARELLQANRDKDETHLWDWFHCNCTGITEVDKVTARKVKPINSNK